MNILVIEDDPTDRKLLSTLLSTDGHGVVMEESAERALEEITRWTPAVIILDLKLPGMDGLELARLLKTRPNTRQIPILAFTAAHLNFSLHAALAAGCDAFVSKPIDTRTLPRVVAMVASRTPRMY